MSCKFLDFLKESNFKHVRLVGHRRYIAIAPFLFTHAIVIGTIDRYDSYDDRWCYETYDSALAALKEWDGTGEPKNWHRHPATGRRRPNGNSLEEYINL